LAMVCVCKRERERKRVVFRVDLFKAWAPGLSFDSPFKIQRVSVYWMLFPGTHLFLVPFPSTTLTYLWRKEGRLFVLFFTFDTVGKPSMNE
jgi:hypothetical protein